MSTIKFFPSKSYSIRRYTLARNDAEIGQIDCGGPGGAAAITIGGTTCTPVTDSVLRGKFHLDMNGARVASAQSVGIWRRYFTVQAGEKSYILKQASWFGRRFALLDDGAEVGRIGVTNALSGRSSAELPDDLPPERQAFLIWLVISTWRRAATTAVVAGSMAGR